LNAYLETRGTAVRSLREVIGFNNRNPSREMPYFGQDLMIKSESKGSTKNKAYRDLIARLGRLAHQDGLDLVMSKFKLDALIVATGGPGWPID
jgi:amidase